MTTASCTVTIRAEVGVPGFARIVVIGMTGGAIRRIGR